MTKVIAPLLSLDARGQFAKTITYAKLGMTNYTKTYKAPTNPKTGAQTFIRLGTKFITEQWAPLTANQKESWQDLANAANLSPYHAYLTFNTRRWRLNDFPAKRPTPLSSSTTAVLKTLTATLNGEVYHIEAAIQQPNHVPWCLRIYASTTDPCPQLRTNLIGAIIHYAVPAQTYYYQLYWQRPASNPYYFTAQWGDQSGGPGQWIPQS